MWGARNFGMKHGKFCFPSTEIQPYQRNGLNLKFETFKGDSFKYTFFYSILLHFMFINWKRYNWKKTNTIKKEIQNFGTNLVIN